MPEVSASVRAMRAMAHPLRLRIAELLATSPRPLRPQDMAEALGEPGNVVRYHVTALYKAGLLRRVEQPDADRRERWYVLSTGPSQLLADEDAQDTQDARHAVGTVQRAIHLRHANGLLGAQESQDHPLLHADGSYLLTPEQAEHAIEALSTVYDEIAAASQANSHNSQAADDAGARRYGLLVDLYPDQPVTAKQDVPSPGHVGRPAGSQDEP